MVTVNIGGGAGDPDVILPKDASVVLNDAVYIDGAGVMMKAFAGPGPTPPAVGFVSKVISPTSGELRTEKTLGGFTALPVGARMYLSDSTPGAITPVSPVGPGSFSQGMGIVISPTTILIEPTDVDTTVNG